MNDSCTDFEDKEDEDGIDGYFDISEDDIHNTDIIFSGSFLVQFSAE